MEILGQISTEIDNAADTVLWPALERLLLDYPDIHVELSIDSSLTDIVTDRFDAGGCVWAKRLLKT